MKINENKFVKEVWLNYFNNILFEKGLITEKEKNRMNSLIYQECNKNS